MKYYSEEEVNRVLRPIVDSYVLDHALQRMVPTFLPTFESTSSDRERIRMELYSGVYLKASGLVYPAYNDRENEAKAALESFDKQFPKP